MTSVDDAYSWLADDADEEDWFMDNASAAPGVDSNGVLEITPSEFAESIFYYVNEKKKPPVYEPMTFEPRPYLREIYDTKAKRVLLCTSRQVEKTTTIGNKMLTKVSLTSGYTYLYVSPSQMQTCTFSNDRISGPIDTSPYLRSLKKAMVRENVLEKRFANNSQIILRYAFLNAERTRGISANALCMDEFQDIIQDNVPVIEMTTSHADEESKSFLYVGTPKSLDNGIEIYRSTRSTQHEWVIPCDCRGGEGGRFWNILCEKNIGKDFAICERCGKQLDIWSKEAQWAAQCGLDPNNKIDWVSYRICQLMVKWRSWPEIMIDYRTYSRAKFYNEVLGISYDSGLKPITQAQLMALCKPDISMAVGLDELRKTYFGRDISMGLDYGSGERAFTVITLGCYVNAEFRIFYAERCVGEFAEFEPQVARIAQLIEMFNVKTVGADFGYGAAHNDWLVRRYGKKIFKYQYVAKQNRKIVPKPQRQHFTVHRTDIMGDIFNALRRNVFEFPNWNEFKTPFAQDILAIFTEENEKLRQLQYNHSPDMPDDTFHSITYCFLASMIWRPREDVIRPRKAGDHTFGIPLSMQ